MIAKNKIEDSYWESAVDVIDLYNGSYRVAGRKRQTRNKPVNAWFLKMDVNGNIISQWNEPDYGMLILTRKQQGNNFATGILHTYDGGFSFFGFTDNHRLRLIKMDSYGFISNY